MEPAKTSSKMNPVCLTMAAAAGAGNTAPAAAIQCSAEWLGMGAANLATVLRPDLIVPGGGVAELGGLLLNPVAVTKGLAK